MVTALGLDISSSIVGWSVQKLTDPKPCIPCEWNYIDLRKLKGQWEKIDNIAIEFLPKIDELQKKHGIIKHLFVEDAVQRFRTGMSSAHTIATLAKFNALVSYVVRNHLNIDPVYIGATQARKLLKLNLVSKNKAKGLGQKEQVFKQLSEGVFSSYMWPLNRNNKIQPYCYDMIDSYVIVEAGRTLLDQPNTHIV